MSKVKINNKIINTNSTTLLYKANIFLLFTEVRNPRQKQNARESVKEALLLDIKRTGLPCIANANIFIELFLCVNQRVRSLYITEELPSHLAKYFFVSFTLK